MQAVREGSDRREEAKKTLKKTLKKFQKSVDKAETMWYNNKAVAKSDSVKVFENWTTHIKFSKGNLMAREVQAIEKKWVDRNWKCRISQFRKRVKNILNKVKRAKDKKLGKKVCRPKGLYI